MKFEPEKDGKRTAVREIQRAASIGVIFVGGAMLGQHELVFSLCFGFCGVLLTLDSDHP